MWTSSISEKGGNRAKPVILCVNQLKLGKACGPDELSSEHIKYAHPVLILHIPHLFRFMCFHGVVPDDFGAGTCIPLLKDKSGDINDINNYRGITLIPVISKLFELVLLHLCESLLTTDDLQFGFKKHLGCNNALFTVRATIDYFCSRGSNVYAAALDLHKAFDSVNHMKLLSSLVKFGLPLWFVDILLNWYGKLTVVVRWNGVFSESFLVPSGVRQGSSLSPALFNVFINAFIISLRELRLGCCVNNDFIGCVLYADDIFLMSASVAGLQSMLDCCFSVSSVLSLSFNCKKSYCMLIGANRPSHNESALSEMVLGDNPIPWCPSFKYLGISFVTGRRLKVDCDIVKRKFFAACNSILGNSTHGHEMVRLALQESYCLPILQYGLAALHITGSQLNELNAAWNMVYRRIFGYHKYESVRLLIHCLGRLDFLHLSILSALRFYKSCLKSESLIVANLMFIFSMTGEFKLVCLKAGLCNNLSNCSWSYLNLSVAGSFSSNVEALDT